MHHGRSAEEKHANITGPQRILLVERVHEEVEVEPQCARHAFASSAVQCMCCCKTCTYFQFDIDVVHAHAMHMPADSLPTGARTMTLIHMGLS